MRMYKCSILIVQYLCPTTHVGTWTPPKAVLPRILPIAFTTDLAPRTSSMLDSAIYRDGLDRGEIEMGFAMECN